MGRLLRRVVFQVLQTDPLLAAGQVKSGSDTMPSASPLLSNASSFYRITDGGFVLWSHLLHTANVIAASESLSRMTIARPRIPGCLLSEHPRDIGNGT